MRSLIISIFTFLMVCPSILAASSDIKICLTGRVEENFPSYKQALTNSVHLATDSSEAKNHIQIRDFFYDDRPLSPLAAYNKMVADNCSAIIGFEYLSDLLLVEKNQKNENIPIFTSYASGLTNKGVKENVFIFRPSYGSLSQSMIDFLLKKYKKIDSVLLVTQVSRDSMKEYKQAYVNQLAKFDINYDSFDFVENDKYLATKLTSYIAEQNTKYGFIVLLAGVIDSAKTANILNDKNIIYIGTENFGSTNSASFYIRLKDKKKKAFFIRNLDFINADSELTKFEKLYTERYKSNPLLISAYTYDATKIIIDTYEKFGEINILNIRKINYEGVTGAKISGGAFSPSSKYIILESTGTGYKESEENSSD